MQTNQDATSEPTTAEAVTSLQTQWSPQSKELAAIEAVADYANAHALLVAARAGLETAVVNSELAPLLEKIRELKADIAALDEEFATRVKVVCADSLRVVADAESALDAARVAAAQAVIRHGKTIKTAGFTAKYVSGTRKWNADMMEGFALAHPEIKAAFSQGEPSVQITPVKKGAGDE